MGRVIDSTEFVRVERSLAGTGQMEAALSEFGPGSYLAAIQVVELAMGMHLANTPGRAGLREAFLDAILGKLTLIPFAEREAREMARIQAVLRRMGTPIGDRDLQIAATALAHGHEVLTRNVKDFAKIPGLIVIDAAPG